jgi:hypothetical protein
MLTMPRKALPFMEHHLSVNLLTSRFRGERQQAPLPSPYTS